MTNGKRDEVAMKSDLSSKKNAFFLAGEGGSLLHNFPALSCAFLLLITPRRVCSSCGYLPRLDGVDG